MFDIMSIFKRSLRSFFLIVPVLVICSMSSVTMAWKGDTLSPWVGTSLTGKKCAGLQVPFGPYDYLQRDKLRAELEVVEETHFSTDVANLGTGQTSTAIADVHYTLMAWPNHHGALHSAVRYRLQHRGEWPADSGSSPAECYLQRAINFSPKDPIPYMLYGLLLHQMKEYDKALTAYRTANRLRPNDVVTQYNMGLTLVELKNYKEAEQLAKKVYSAGFPLPGLRNKLVAAGHWSGGSGAAEPKGATLEDAVNPAPVPEKTNSPEEMAQKKAATGQPTP